MSPVTPSGSGNENKYAAVNKPRRDPTEVELHDNPNYEAPNSAWTHTYTHTHTHTRKQINLYRNWLKQDVMIIL